MTLLCPGNAITLVQHTCVLNPPEQFRFFFIYMIKLMPFSFSRLNVEVATLALLSLSLSPQLARGFEPSLPADPRTHET